MVEVQGECDEQFAGVREAFAGNFQRHGDVGAAFALYHRGRKVVDLWGGVADSESDRPWAEDTLQLVFSTTKGATAICAHLLAQRGELDLDAPVTTYWPEFAAAGKGDIPVRWLLSHRAGLPVVDGSPAPQELLDWDPIVKRLADQAPVWPPGTTHGYHALTYGWLVGEVVKRVAGRSLGQFFADEVAGPLGLEFWIGLPPSEEHRVSRLIALPWATLLEMEVDSIDLSHLPEFVQKIARSYLDPTSITNRALHVTSPPLDWNAPEVHAAEIPAASGIATARSLARMYAACVSDVDGIRLLSPETLATATTEQSVGRDSVLLVPTRFGLGFFLPSPFATMGGPRSFGHSGAGGSLGYADPDTEIGFGYVMNKMQQNLGGDPRTLTLIEAVNRSL